MQRAAASSPPPRPAAAHGFEPVWQFLLSGTQCGLASQHIISGMSMCLQSMRRRGRAASYCCFAVLFTRHHTRMLMLLISKLRYP